MSKAFTKETENEDDEELPDIPDSLPLGAKNYMTPQGHAALVDELKHLRTKERPEVVEVVAWAAGNGDRSENGDYIYGKKRLREIDRRIRFLMKRLDNAESSIRPNRKACNRSSSARPLPTKPTKVKKTRFKSLASTRRRPKTAKSVGYPRSPVPFTSRVLAM